MKKQIIFIVGPTAVGKSEVAVRLAKKINAEIISCDSMQVYKGMDIVASMPSAHTRKKVRHHLLGVIPATKEYNVSKYHRDALKKIKEIVNKDRLPLFVGGTGLYMSIIMDGLFKMKQPPVVIREALYKEARLHGSAYLHNRLKKIDPETAAKIHPNDTKRIIRALEVFKATGKPISFLQKQRKGICDKYDVRVFCLNLARERLNKRIEVRVEKMFRQGLIGEVKKLLKLDLSKTAWYAIGIKEVKGYLEDLYDLDKAKAMMKHNTRAYAKRQLTWFRKDKRIKWIGIKDRQTAKEIANKLWKELF